MKKYKVVNPLPMHSAGMGFVAGAAMGAASPASSLVAGAVGAGIGAIAGGFAARRDAAKGRLTHMNDAASKARK